ncbi:forkhead box protein N3 [Biomphalaria pfeifferi]|uniref:Forkhead box protein N3 n=1 Tax=Biomphalaria pfeifferi TaxID=112525 RepID=A0AAD8AWR2_BIOPF|nr:forkhead box protein N3 [Biomphalaria pfeifferi]
MNDSGCEDTVPSMVCKLPEESDASMRARLFTSLSQSFPHSQLYKALHGGEDINLNGGDNSEDDDDSLYGDHLSNSCFASLRMDRRDSDDFDDDLQSLEWLQSEDLLKNIGGEKLDKDEEESGEQKENEDIKPDVSALAEPTRQQPIAIAPFLPKEHVKSKPPYSFSCLIFMAVEASPQKRLPVKDIYNWILTQFPYFQNAPTGWKNSVRHNLSLNKCFKKVEKDKGQSIGKGSLWCIDPAYRPNLLQALRKTPYHPYHQLQMTSTQPQNYLQYLQTLPGGGRTVLPLTQRPVPNTVSPHLFPFLSRRLAQTSFDVDNEMKDVAQTLVALKTSHKLGPTDNSAGEDTGPTWKHHKRTNRRTSVPVVVTEHPYSDHSYSCIRLIEDDVPSPSSSSSIDEEYDFGDADEESDYQSDMEWDSDDKDEVDGDVQPHKRLKIDLQDSDGETYTVKKVIEDESEDDEQKKIHEGASALLNLAGLYRSNSSTSNSPNCGTEKKKMERTSSKKRNSAEKKLKLSKKKKEEKKQVVSELPEPSVRKSKSKRKNAGSNGKYASGEYSLLKTSRTPTKGRISKPTKTLKSSTANSETNNSIQNKDSDKANSSTSKPKSSVKTKSPKKGSEKKKLKLSKNFGTSKKQTASLSAENSAISASVGQPYESSTKKSFLKKGNTPAVVSGRKKKSLSDPSRKISSSRVEDDSNSSSKKDHPKASENVSIQPSLVEKKPADLGESLQEYGESKSVSSSLVAHIFKTETISPAGDAPAITSSSSSDKLANQKDKSATGSKLPADAKSNGNKSSASGTLTIINVSHKSPHFTRFSKKKASMS